ncbi:hypothetical protein [Nostoc punctiforme]|nr:hypothetical protein [Nostoc punctiforme]
MNSQRPESEQFRTYAQATENLTTEDAAKSRSAGFRRSELFKTEDTEE